MDKLIYWSYTPLNILSQSGTNSLPSSTANIGGNRNRISIVELLNPSYFNTGGNYNHHLENPQLGANPPVGVNPPASANPILK